MEFTQQKTPSSSSIRLQFFWFFKFNQFTWIPHRYNIQFPLYVVITNFWINTKKALNSKQKNEHDHEDKKLMILIEINKKPFYQKILSFTPIWNLWNLMRIEPVEVDYSNMIWKRNFLSGIEHRVQRHFDIDILSR